MTRVYDLAMTHQLDADDLFIHCVQRRCAEARLNFFLVEPVWVEPFFRLLSQGTLWTKVLLNMHSEHHRPDEIYHRLIRLAAERNVRVIDPPDRAMEAFDKSRLHPKLIGAGVPTPFTVIVPNPGWASFRLGDADRVALGVPFVIKPALGYGRRGVILDASAEADIERSASLWGDGHYLLQKRIEARLIRGEPAYFRAFFVFGTVWLCWWNCHTHRYRMLTWEDLNQHGLGPVEALVRQIAAITGMDFFSSEIVQTEAGEFVVIDYVNDQCHMLSQSASPGHGMPDELIQNIARRLVEAVSEMVRR